MKTSVGETWNIKARGIVEKLSRIGRERSQQLASLQTEAHAHVKLSTRHSVLLHAQFILEQQSKGDKRVSCCFLLPTCGLLSSFNSLSF